MTANHQLPSGTITFLFTDLQDSTRLWEQLPDEMGDAIIRHHALIADSVREHGGHVVKTIGDGSMAVFDDAGRAVACAVAIQRVLVAEESLVNLAARVGLHTGVAHASGGDYHGPAVNRAARVSAVAHPGQILLSAATAALVEEWPLRDLGEHELRGLPPTRLFQVVANGLQAEFPRPATGLRRSHLPSPPTTFVGREAAIASIVGLIAEHRLVTLSGVGGCGKTRLAIEVAARSAGEFPDGVFFVDLAAVTDEARVADAVADAFGLGTAVSARAPVERVADYIASRSVLCVLDNCEHLVDGCAVLAERLIENAGPSRLLATSREPLAVAGEQVVTVGSLDIDTDSVRLFADRASEARAQFAIGDANRSTITQICRRLDGIPLAIELAAAQTAHLSAAQVLERLDDRFRLLTGGRRRVQRQQTLAATLDWSHDLLTLAEQTLLRRLAVFPASFSLDAADAVGAADGTVEAIANLVAKSLVQIVDNDHDVRYRLLETVRMYAESKLADADEADASRDRHRDWVLAWLESRSLEERWFGDVDVLAIEHPSLRAALDWSQARDDSTATARLAAGVDWSRSEAFRDGQRCCVEVVDDVALSPELRLRVHAMLWWLGPISQDSGTHRERLALDSYHGPSHALLAMVQTGLARDLTITAVGNRDDTLISEVVDLAESGVAMSAGHAVPWQMLCRLTAGMAYASLHYLGPREYLERADKHFADALALAEPAAPYLQLYTTLEGHCSLTRLLLGDAPRALELAQHAVEHSASPGRDQPPPYWQHPRGIALAAALGESGDDTGARRALREYHETMRRTDWVWGNESVAVLGGVLAAQRGDFMTASRLLAAGARAAGRTPADAILYRTYRDRVRTELGPEAARQLRAEGRGMTLDAAITLAFA